MPSATPLCSVTVRDLKGAETRYKIKRHAKMGEIFTDHANRRSATLDSLRFLHNGELIHEDQTLSPLTLAGSIKINCFPAQGGSATP